MTNKTYTVVKDQCHENMGTPSTVGQTVTTIVAIPAGTEISVYAGGTFCGTSRTIRDVYLTIGGQSRTSSFGQIVDRTFVVGIDGALYQGNDVYTTEELGITE
ncbi:hypothetical protein [Staphylococcus haemolyticus]|uniref:hypothetical protein n=1 Tax=Staphylococcus haemolyticus TaxID=1283 RepID=UPI001E464C48|nr:hypothetical protein [Staphylococcus haemolyticus]MCC3723718.1 hypothetical protein [Staphylococcus haemolyticus]